MAITFRITETGKEKSKILYPARTANKRKIKPNKSGKRSSIIPERKPVVIANIKSPLTHHPDIFTSWSLLNATAIEGIINDKYAIFSKL